MRILLTGASGKVGHELLRVFAANGHSVIAVGRNASRLIEACQPFKERVTAVPCDLSGSLESIPTDCELVVHAAAHSSSEDSADAHVLGNVIGTRNLLKHVARGRGNLFVFLSSISVNGDVKESIVDENTEIRNPGSYGVSKLLGEMMLREQSGTFRSIALRLPGVIGPGANAPWLARALAEARAGRAVKLYSPETLFNNAVHVEDLANFICTLPARVVTGFDVLTLAASESKPFGKVVEHMFGNMKDAVELLVVPSPRAPFTISITKAVEKYGYAPMSVLDSVRRFAESG